MSSKRFSIRQEHVAEAIQGDQPGPPWGWRCRLSERGHDVIDKWHDSVALSKTAKANFERRRDQLSQLDFVHWERPAAARLKDHICVIHFKDESSKQWRVFGFASRAHKCFVMTNVAFEKDDEYTPKSSAEDAVIHHAHVRADIEQYSCVCFD